jgi:hypothetical protein
MKLSVPPIGCHSQPHRRPHEPRRRHLAPQAHGGERRPHGTEGQAAHEPEPEDLAMAMTFRVFAVLGVLTFLVCCGFALHAVTHWLWWEGK